MATPPTCSSILSRSSRACTDSRQWNVSNRFHHLSFCRRREGVLILLFAPLPSAPPLPAPLRPTPNVQGRSARRSHAGSKVQDPPWLEGPTLPPIISSPMLVPPTAEETPNLREYPPNYGIIRFKTDRTPPVSCSRTSMHRRLHIPTRRRYGPRPSRSWRSSLFSSSK
jgi:hypothetical protein